MATHGFVPALIACWLLAPAVSAAGEPLAKPATTMEPSGQNEP